VAGAGRQNVPLGAEQIAFWRLLGFLFPKNKKNASGRLILAFFARQNRCAL
jgi:hypothetical protein